MAGAGLRRGAEVVSGGEGGGRRGVREAGPSRNIDARGAANSLRRVPHFEFFVNPQSPNSYFLAGAVSSLKLLTTQMPRCVESSGPHLPIAPMPSPASREGRPQRE